MAKIAIIGGGIVGCGLALHLHERGIEATIYEGATEVRELGVGITILPHAMRELKALGLQEELVDVGIVNKKSAFYNRFGQLIFEEPRGVAAGYDYPEVGIHRGRLHMALFNKAKEVLPPAAIVTDHFLCELESKDDGVSLKFKSTATGELLQPINADAVIACDGVNSAVRRCFYPDEQPAFAGINTWRGAAWMPRLLDGHTYLRVGAIKTGKMVIYPIAENENGEQLINWVAEKYSPDWKANDWNRGGSVDDVLPHYSDWEFDWLDVPEMIRRSEPLLEYPMVDKDPVDQWSFGPVTFAGDAAHPMYPRGSNGSAQGLIDARVLADLINNEADLEAAFSAYENDRRPTTSKVVLSNRSVPPDLINTVVEERVGDRPFDNLSDFVTQDELREISENYKKIAGFSVKELEKAAART